MNMRPRGLLLARGRLVLDSNGLESIPTPLQNKWFQVCISGVEQIHTPAPEKNHIR